MVDSVRSTDSTLVLGKGAYKNPLLDAFILPARIFRSLTVVVELGSAL